MNRICAGDPPTVGCEYYVSWDAYVVLGDDWIYEGGGSASGGRWMRLGEALIASPSSSPAVKASATINHYCKYFDAVKSNSRGRSYALFAFGGMWGRAEGKTTADPGEFFHANFWSPREGKVTTTDIRFTLGGSLANHPYYVNFASRCGGLPDFKIVPCGSPIYRGNAAPPPPPPKNMCGCDCNTIASIIEERIANQNKPIKDHIDQRTIEQLKAVNKMLQGMKIDLDLQPVIDRINEVEANLWNGPQGE